MKAKRKSPERVWAGGKEEPRERRVLEAPLGARPGDNANAFAGGFSLREADPVRGART